MFKQYKHKMHRIGKIVAFEYERGTWKIIGKIKGSPGWDCDRYDIQNTSTGEMILGVRDKEIFTKDDEFFNHFAYGG